MEIVVSVDDRGRVLIPREIREKAGIKGGSKVLLKLREDGVIELIPLNRIFEEVFRVFDEKFKDWREEDHEASKMLKTMIK